MNPVRISHRSFRSKILRTVIISLVFVLGLTGLGLVAIESWLSEQKLSRDMEVLADILGNRSRVALDFGDQITAEENLTAAKFDKNVDAICMYDNQDRLFSMYQRPSTQVDCKDELDAKGFAINEQERHLVTVKEIFWYDKKLGTVVVVANRQFIVEALTYFVPMMLLLIVLVVWIAAHLIRRLLKAMTRPLEDLHETSQALVEDAYSSRRVAKRSDDEIGELVEVFNRMLDNLASENLALQSSENRFRALTAHAPIGIFQLDSEGNLVYANQTWYGITETNGDPSPFTTHQRRISADDAEFYRANLDKAAQKCTPVMMEYRYEDSKLAKGKYLMENIAPLGSSEGLQGMIGTLADVSELKNAQAELEKLAFYDPLTNLPNRRFFSDLLGFGLAKARRANSKAAVLMLDMDNFKRVNDLLGHSGGDQLLQQQAQRIRAAVREQDAVSRMGGDEFTIMLSPVSEISEVTTLAKRVLDSVNAPVMIRNHKMEVGASIGVALYPSDGENVEDLIRNADMALYEAKNEGRNRVNFFSFKLDLELRESMRIERKLKEAIHDCALDAYLQPQVNHEGKVIWAEALARWKDPEEGFISPARFVPLAEETGLIHNLGHWMLTQICFHLSKHRNYLEAEGIQGVSVNLSGRQFYSRSLIKDIYGVMQEHGVEPHQLEFELTESVVMDDIQLAIDIMKGIRELGCRLAIDDFGTGYSSLSYLKRFPISALKIDRSFVEDIPSDAYGSEIATAIIAMAHKLKLNVVAEGVETEQQRDFLVSQGCECMQGYLFGKPIDVQEYVNSGRIKTLKSGGQVTDISTGRPLL